MTDKEGKEKPSLAKEMTLRDYIFLAVGTIIGTAWAILTGNIIGEAGPVGAVMAFIFGGLLLIPIGLAYAELTACMPVAGGPITHSYRAFGSFSSFLTGWAYVLGYLPLCAWESVSLGAIIGWIIPGMSTMPLYTIGAYTIYLPQLLVSLLSTIIFTVINVVGIKLSAKFQNIMTVILFICGFVIVAAGLLYGKVENMQPILIGGTAFESLGKILRVLVTFVIFLMCGFETVPQQAEEKTTKFEPKQFGIPIILGIALAAMFYISIIVATSMVVPWPSLLSMELPLFDAFKAAFKLPIIVYLVTICALMGLLTTFNGLFMAGARILLALGRERLIPETFVKIHPKFNTPHIAVIFIGVTTFIGTFFGKSIWLPLVNVTAVGFALSWLFETAAALKLKFSEPDLPRPFMMYGGKATAAIGVVTCISFIVLLLLPGSPAQITWPIEYLILVAWLIIGVALYYYPKSSYLKHTFIKK